jgi:hypothetical protein
VNTKITDPHQEKVSKKKKGIEIAELDLQKAKFQAEKQRVKEPLKKPKVKSVRERLRSRVGSKVELDDEVAAIKAEIDEQFKNDPVEREKRHRLVDDEARDSLT